MKNSELIHRLSQFPPDIDVEIHISRSSKLHKLLEVYMGNEQYMPNGKKGQPNKIFIEVD